MDELYMLLDLLLALVLGFVIGFERKLRSKEAGIRTHTIVCLGSALMMIVSIYAFGDNADTARVAAQIVSGVGFLGAGMIVYKQHEVRGLTTAAGVWATAGVGMACGGRMYIVAVGVTALIILCQLLFHSKIRPFRRKRTYSVNIVFLWTNDENMIIKNIFGTDRFYRLVIKREDGQVVYRAMLNTEKEFSSGKLNEIIAQNPFILSIERCENE